MHLGIDRLKNTRPEHRHTAKMRKPVGEAALLGADCPAPELQEQHIGRKEFIAAMAQDNSLTHGFYGWLDGAPGLHKRPSNLDIWARGSLLSYEVDHFDTHFIPTSRSLQTPHGKLAPFEAVVHQDTIESPFKHPYKVDESQHRTRFTLTFLDSEADPRYHEEGVSSQYSLLLPAGSEHTAAIEADPYVLVELMGAVYGESADHSGGKMCIATPNFPESV